MRSFEQHKQRETVQMITLHAINPRGYRELQLIDSQFKEEEKGKKKKKKKKEKDPTIPPA